MRLNDTEFLLQWILSFQYSLNDWCFLIFLFVSLLRPNAQESSWAIKNVKITSFTVTTGQLLIFLTNIFYAKILKLFRNSAPTLSLGHHPGQCGGLQLPLASNSNQFWLCQKPMRPYFFCIIYWLGHFKLFWRMSGTQMWKLSSFPMQLMFLLR